MSTNAANLSQLIDRARQGNEDAFATLINHYYRRIFTHCYQMLGSPQDAEDAVQETSFKAWKRLQSFTGKGSFQSWLYAIATNVCLDARRKRSSRSLVQGNTAPLDDITAQLVPLAEDIWLQPIPDKYVLDDRDNPEAIYSMRECVSLAFMTVLQKLPPRQRAVLLLRDVLNWKAQEVAEHLDMTVSAVNSALIRGRKTLQDEQYSSRYRNRPSDEKIRELLDQYIFAWESENISLLVTLLKEDAILTMPPLPMWFQGYQSIQAFFAEVIFSGNGINNWHLQSIGANLQPAYALYRLNETTKTYDLFCLEVLTVSDHQITRLDHFMAPGTYIAGNVESTWLKYFDLATQD